MPWIARWRLTRSGNFLNRVEERVNQILGDDAPSMTETLAAEKRREKRLKREYKRQKAKEAKAAAAGAGVITIHDSAFYDRVGAQDLQDPSFPWNQVVVEEKKDDGQEEKKDNGGQEERKEGDKTANVADETDGKDDVPEMPPSPSKKTRQFPGPDLNSSDNSDRSLSPAPRRGRGALPAALESPAEKPSRSLSPQRLAPLENALTPSLQAPPKPADPAEMLAAKPKSKSPPPKKKLEMWTCPATGSTMEIRMRDQYLKTSPHFRECWQASLAAVVEKLGKIEVESRVSQIWKASRCTAEEAFCALAECDGEVEIAKQKMVEPEYKAEMALASEACELKKIVGAKKKRRKKRHPQTPKQE